VIDSPYPSNETVVSKAVPAGKYTASATGQLTAGPNETGPISGRCYLYADASQLNYAALTVPTFQEAGDVQTFALQGVSEFTASGGGTFSVKCDVTGLDSVAASEVRLIATKVGSLN
jgi:hypothetical protein